MPTANAFLEEFARLAGQAEGEGQQDLHISTAARAADAGRLRLEAELWVSKSFGWTTTSRAQDGGGATVAARLNPDGLAELRREAEGLAKSVAITKRIVDKPAKK
ncbi:MAG: hypothetical protein U0797_22100 [Gemmataceae bacterium]